MHSDIFHMDKTPANRNHIDMRDIESRGGGPNQKMKDFVDTHNEEHRKKDQRYSDIFGSEDLIAQNEKFSSSPKKKSLKVPTKTDWRDSKSELLVHSPSKEGMSPSQMKQHDLKSSLNNSEIIHSARGVQETPEPKKKSENINKLIEDKKEFKPSNRLVSPREPKPMPELTPRGNGIKSGNVGKPKNGTPPKEIESIEYDLRGIPKHLTEPDLRKLFEGFVILDLKTEVNKNNGKLLPSAKIKIKKESSAKLLELKATLKTQGIMMLNHYEKKN